MKTLKTTLFMLVAVALSGVTSAMAEILISTAGPMTGQYASFGEQMKRGAEMAVADINAAGVGLVDSSFQGLRRGEHFADLPGLDQSEADRRRRP